MKLFGVTGGVGMGKSTVANLLACHDIPVADTDDIAHRLVEPGQPALAEIQNALGPSLLQPDGRLDRRAVARLVFADDQARKALERILHPPIRQAWRDETARWREQGRKLGAVIIPLLFETSAESLFDATVCVACSAPVQFDRLRRRGWTDAEIAARLRAQWPVEKKVALADFVLWTGSSLEATAAQTRMIMIDN